MPSDCLIASIFLVCAGFLFCCSAVLLPLICSWWSVCCCFCCALLASKQMQLWAFMSLNHVLTANVRIVLVSIWTPRRSRRSRLGWFPFCFLSCLLVHTTCHGFHAYLFRGLCPMRGGFHLLAIIVHMLLALSCDVYHGQPDLFRA